MRRLWILLLLLVWFPAANATTKYVMDVIYIVVRAEEGDEAKILKTIKSGESMEVIEDKGDFLLVKTGSGDEGWVRSRYLQDDPIAATKLDAVSGKLKSVQEENNQLKALMNELRKEVKEQDKTNKDLLAENKKINKEFGHISEVAQKPLEISNENRGLKENNESMKAQIDALQLENAKYKEAGNRDWFLTGAGVVVLGVIMGLIIPRIRWRRRAEWA